MSMILSLRRVAVRFMDCWACRGEGERESGVVGAGRGGSLHVFAGAHPRLPG